MKIIILGDQHFGARNDNEDIAENQRLFYDNVLWPYVEANDLRIIISTGDTFDTPGYLTTKAMKQASYCYRMPVAETDIRFIVGNHDLAEKNSTKHSVLEMAFQQHNVVSEPDLLVFENTMVLLMPWICPDNYDECIAAINDLVQTGKNNPKMKTVLIGHFEMKDIKMNKTTVSKHGTDKSLFAGIDLVLSGHYHTRSINDNIVYVGTPYQLTWHDANEVKGFYVLDTETCDLEFVENPYNLFQTVDASSEIKVADHVKFVEIIVPPATKMVDVNKFISDNCQDMNVTIRDLSIESVKDTDVVPTEFSLDKMTGFDDLVTSHVSGLELTDEKKVRVIAMLKELKDKVL